MCRGSSGSAPELLVDLLRLGGHALELGVLLGTPRAGEGSNPLLRGPPPASPRCLVVYSGVVGRTQVYLTDEELALLDKARQASGASRSELIRRAVRATFGRSTSQTRLAALERGAGLWRDRPLDGAGYVDGVRGDLNERLARRGL